jgi:hypothetical protein
MADPLSTFALAAGLGWASGMRLYAAVFFLGILHRLEIYQLPPDLVVLAHPAVMWVSGVLFVLELLVDKVPGLDSLWDTAHTFIRIPAGALLAAAAVASGEPGYMLAAALLGGTIAAGTHLVKAASRALVNTSPEPFTNWTLSLTEDAASIGGLALAIIFPLAFLVILAFLALLAIWLLPRFVRGLRELASLLRKRLA